MFLQRIQGMVFFEGTPESGQGCENNYIGVIKFMKYKVPPVSNLATRFKINDTMEYYYTT